MKHPWNILETSLTLLVTGFQTNDSIGWGIFSCVKTVICELMLLKLDDFLGSSLLRNFFSAASSIFSCKAVLFSISGGSEPNSVIMILPNSALTSASTYSQFFHPTTHDDIDLVSEPPDLQNKTVKYLQENIDLSALKLFLSKSNPNKSPNYKSISCQFTKIN